MTSYFIILSREETENYVLKSQETRVAGEIISFHLRVYRSVQLGKQSSVYHNLDENTLELLILYFPLQLNFLFIIFSSWLQIGCTKTSYFSIF